MPSRCLLAAFAQMLTVGDGASNVDGGVVHGSAAAPADVDVDADVAVADDEQR
jgi:hypothetical protein